MISEVNFPIHNINNTLKHQQLLHMNNFTFTHGMNMHLWKQVFKICNFVLLRVDVLRVTQSQYQKHNLAPGEKFNQKILVKSVWNN